jgi:hypothetical protein
MVSSQPILKVATNETRKAGPPLARLYKNGEKTVNRDLRVLYNRAGVAPTNEELAKLQKFVGPGFTCAYNEGAIACSE